MNASGYIHQLFPRLPADEPPKLTALGIRYRVQQDIINFWSIGQPSLRPYAHTLTTLVITIAWLGFGRDILFAFSYEDLKKDFADKVIHPGDLKAAVRDAIISLLEPIQKAYKESEEWQEIEKLAYPPPVVETKKSKSI